MKIEDLLIVDPVDGEYTGSVKIGKGKIVDIRRYHCTPKAILMPGFVDVHTHGQYGIDTMSAKAENFEEWAKRNFEQGVTTFLPTTVSASFEDILKVEDALAKLPSSIAGLHLEGPFISKEKKGAQNPEHIISVTNGFEQILRYPVKIITAAPEIDGFNRLVGICRKKGIVVSIGHSMATYSVLRRAFEMGIDRITHFPNALSTLHHRELGVTGSGLYLDFNLEIIADGIHSVPEFVDFVYRVKGADRLMLVTDSISATGLENGIYELGGLKLELKGKRAELVESRSLAGSTLLFNDAVKNFRKFTNCSLKELSKVSSYNSLLSLGITGLGRIKEGYTANLALLNEDLTVLKTIFKGEEVYNK
ncbi:N-acetylglucosamine-6-phosphate deacetylase [Kosmotoga pacifica]|uniref:N-acetylglucosamine-6-phosphate deacetylase n=1 Tax=Kosmotoga pacifica TaxID=1330330 RepID=A0A0G2Z9J4_9BACT|nr:N-acetylglucosamine-6-phosphate deacetylase [Kosmotoga pacifica]